MKKTDRSQYYHEAYYAYHAHFAALAAEGGRPEDGLGACCFSTSSSEVPSEDEDGTPPCPGPTLRVSASPSMADSEGMLSTHAEGFRELVVTDPDGNRIRLFSWPEARHR